MHPDEKMFASAGAGGKVVLREARIEGDEGWEQGEEGQGWGKELKVLETGRDKFGMDLKFVSLISARTRCCSSVAGGSRSLVKDGH